MNKIELNILFCCVLTWHSFSNLVWCWVFCLMIYLWWLFNAKSIFIEGQYRYYLTHDWKIRDTYVVHSISVQTFLYKHLKLSKTLDNSGCYCYTSYEMINFYDFSFKWTDTAGIGIYPTKAWLSQLVNFKNAIWTWGHFRKTICHKILF